MSVPEINPTSRDWKIVEGWAQSRLADYRKRLESINLDDRSTVILRARISELVALLELGKASMPEPVMPQIEGGEYV